MICHTFRLVFVCGCNYECREDGGEAKRVRELGRDRFVKGAGMGG